MNCKYQEGRFLFKDESSKTLCTYVNFDDPRKLILADEMSLTVISYIIETKDVRITHINKFIDKFLSGELSELGFMDTSGVCSHISSKFGKVGFHTNTKNNYWASNIYIEVPYVVCKEAVLQFCRDCKDV